MSKLCKAASLILSLFTLGLSAWAQPLGKKPATRVEGDSVTFCLSAPSAKDVRVWGSFIPGKDSFGKGGSLRMRSLGDGTWKCGVKGLTPDFYVYYYTVDGTLTLDPSNTKVVRNYTDYCNYFIIEGGESRNLEFPEGERGSLVSLWYDSPEYGAIRRLNVYLPAGYDASKQYPVLYLLHGGGDDEDTWLDMGRLPQIMDNLILRGEALPMVIVLPNDMPDQACAQTLQSPIEGKKGVFALAGTDAFLRGGDFEEDFIRNIIPTVEKKFSVRKDWEGRAVCGVSMGGAYLLSILMDHPGLFGHIALMGSGYMGKGSMEPLLSALSSAGYSLFWIGVGSGDMALPSAKALMEGMDSKGLPYTYYDCGGVHNWHSWRRDLQKLAPVLFR